MVSIKIYPYTEEVWYLQDGKMTKCTKRHRPSLWRMLILWLKFKRYGHDIIWSKPEQCFHCLFCDEKWNACGERMIGR